MGCNNKRRAKERRCYKQEILCTYEETEHMRITADKEDWNNMLCRSLRNGSTGEYLQTRNVRGYEGLE